MQGVLKELQTYRESEQRALRELRNARVSATRSLPPEILGRIFQEVIDVSRVKFDLQSQRLSCRWIYVSHVCRHWRLVALGTSTLWTELSTYMLPPCWNAYMSRSRSSPLTLRSRWKRISETRQEDVKINFQRIQHMYLEISPSNTEVLGQALPETAPNLRTLAIECDDLFNDNDDDADAWSSSLDDFLYHHAPALQSLYLNRLQFPWGVQLQHLRVLDLGTCVFNHDISEEELTPYEFQYVLETLRASPNLEILKLHGDILFQPPLQTPTPSLTSRLRVLSLSGTLPCIGPILAAYKANPGLYVELRSDEHYDELDWDVQPETMEDWSTDSAIASDILRNHLGSRGGEGPVHFSTVHLVFDGYGISLRLGLEIFLPSEHFPTTTEERDAPPSLNIRLSPQEPHTIDATSIHAKTLKLARGIPDAHLCYFRHLTLSGLYWPSSDVVSFFENAKAVESLSVYAFRRRELHEAGGALARDTAMLLTSLLCTTIVQSHQDSSGSRGPRLFPALRSLYLSGLSFKYLVEHDGRDTMLDTALTTGLAMRQQSGVGLESLQLEDCRHLEKDVLDRWTSLVVQVSTTSSKK